MCVSKNLTQTACKIICALCLYNSAVLRYLQHLGLYEGQEKLIDLSMS